MNADSFLIGKQAAMLLAAWWWQSQGGGGMLMFLPLILIFGVFYLLLILPQQRRQKKWQEMLGQLKTGDKIVTSGGIRGVIMAIKDDYVHLRVPPDNLKIEVARSAIVSVTTGEETKTS